jgi:uncharacterized membrane protein SirB2
MHLTFIFLAFVVVMALLVVAQRTLPPSNLAARISLALTSVLGAIALLGGACLLGIAGWLLLRRETDWALGCLIFGVLFGTAGIASLRLRRRRPEQAGGVASQDH